MYIIRSVIFPVFVTIYLFFILICITEILFLKKSTLLIFSMNKSPPWKARNEVQSNDVSPCLLRMEDAFNTLSLRWFLVFDTALVYHRSKKIDSEQVDVGIFSDGLQAKNVSNIKLLSTLKRFGFKLPSEKKTSKNFDFSRWCVRITDFLVENPTPNKKSSSNRLVFLRSSTEKSLTHYFHLPTWLKSDVKRESLDHRRHRLKSTIWPKDSIGFNLIQSCESILIRFQSDIARSSSPSKEIFSRVQSALAILVRFPCETDVRPSQSIWIRNGASLSRTSWENRTNTPVGFCTFKEKFVSNKEYATLTYTPSYCRLGGYESFCLFSDLKDEKLMSCVSALESDKSSSDDRWSRKMSFSRWSRQSRCRDRTN